MPRSFRFTSDLGVKIITIDYINSRGTVTWIYNSTLRYVTAPFSWTQVSLFEQVITLRINLMKTTGLITSPLNLPNLDL